MLVYFKRLRPKICAVLFFLTAIFVDVWAMSYRSFEEFRFSPHDNCLCHITSMRGNLCIAQLRINPADRTHSTFFLKIPYATVFVPLIVVMTLLLLTRPQERPNPFHL